MDLITENLPVVAAGVTVAALYLLKSVSDNQQARAFVPTKRLRRKDKILLQMLIDNDISETEKNKAAWVVTDPDQNDNPIVHCSAGFSKLTQYSKEEAESRNCRFLQGANTKGEDVKAIRDAVVGKKEANVRLLNYKKDGTVFQNQFFLCPLFDEAGQVAYYVGVQTASPQLQSKTDAEQAAWNLVYNSVTPE